MPTFPRVEQRLNVRTSPWKGSDLHMSKTDNTDPHWVKIAKLAAADLEAWHSGCIHDVRPATKLTESTISHPDRYVEREVVILTCCPGSKRLAFDEAVDHFRALHENEFLPIRSRSSFARRIAAMPKVMAHVWEPAHEETIRTRQRHYRDCDIDEGTHGYGWNHRQCPYVVSPSSERYSWVYAGYDSFDHGHRAARRIDRTALRSLVHSYNTALDEHSSDDDIDTEIDDIAPPFLPKPNRRSSW